LAVTDIVRGTIGQTKNLSLEGDLPSCSLFFSERVRRIVCRGLKNGSAIRALCPRRSLRHRDD
jgi:hypothetical protein